ncbi:6431_t:CDS:2 [Paraglomus brasilianum]|uniref:6431_t:CDS:1 n=1 Tax=Paraglomus brasilianum TaxID=144538 RepID=A0A9N9H7N0_9GLOM|nr:6431_t:CDS:2 [Paraglomus brasilianum]
MPITLFCLVKGNRTANAFAVEIDSGKLISHLKETIKKKDQNDFVGIDAHKLKLWKVEILSGRDDLLSSLSLNDNDELLGANEISEYWTSKLPKKHIHVLVKPPETAAASSREQELLEEVTSLKEKLSKSTHDFDVVVKPKQKANKWTVNIEQASLKDLKNYIRELYKPPALENDGAERCLIPRDVAVASFKTKLKFTVFIETPSKPFSDWSFPKVCQLYGISSDPNPDIDVFPPFLCGSADLNSDNSKAVIKHLMAEIKLRQNVTPLNKANEAAKTIYSYCYLASGVSFYKDNFKLIPEKLIEVKREDFMKGFAQASVQMESTLPRKRKAEEIDNGQDVDRVFGIVTDASEWYFMECSLDNERKPTFKLSEPVTVVYKDENLQVKVEKVLGHIVWLLEEAQKPVESGVKSRKIELMSKA